MDNVNLRNAFSNRFDEFYTSYSDIENEVQHYGDVFRGKHIYCNCSDYRKSNFYKYFKDKFHSLGLRKLSASCYDNGDGAFYATYDGVTEEVVRSNGSGSFNSSESIEMLEQCDIVVENPPFSLWRMYFTTLIDYHKDFIIMGSKSAISYVNVFPYIARREVFIGAVFSEKRFIVPKGNGKTKEVRLGNVCWFTTLQHDKKIPPLELTTKYDPDVHKKFSNFDIINVDKCSEIPCDYYDVMAVPITFVSKWCPEQFDIVPVYKKEPTSMKSTSYIGGGQLDLFLQFESTSDGRKKDIRPCAYNTKEDISHLIMDGWCTRAPCIISDGYVDGIKKFDRITIRRKK